MNIPEERLVLHDDITHQDFVKVVKNNLELIHDETRQTTSEDKKVFQDIWLTPDKATGVSFIDDNDLGFRYLWIGGVQSQEYYLKISKLLHSYDGEDLIESLEFAKDYLQVLYTILKIGVAYPEYDPLAFQVFEYYIGDNNASLRGAVLKAIGFSKWSECRPLVEKTAQTEPEEPLRQFAQRMLEKYQEQTTVGN
jgi:hypothetical protein